MQAAGARILLKAMRMMRCRDSVSLAAEASAAAGRYTALLLK